MSVSLDFDIVRVLLTDTGLYEIMERRHEEGVETWFEVRKCFSCLNGMPSIDPMLINQSHGNEAGDREQFTYEKTTDLPPRTGLAPPAKQQKTKPVLS